MIHSAHHPDGTNATIDNPVSEDGLVPVGELFTIPARQGRAVRLQKGQVLELINPHGHQVCDFFAIAGGEGGESAESGESGIDDGEVLSMEHCRTNLDRVYVRKGDVLVSNRRRAMFELIEDTSPGIHDILVACCDQPRYRQLGVDHYHDNCADNFKMALMAIGVDPVRVPSPFNIWMNIPVDPQGGFTWEAPVSKPGAYVQLKAHMDCIAIMSACPQDITPVNGHGTVPAELEFRILSA